MIEQKN